MTRSEGKRWEPITKIRKLNLRLLRRREKAVQRTPPRAHSAGADYANYDFALNASYSIGFENGLRSTPGANLNPIYLRVRVRAQYSDSVGTHPPPGAPAPPRHGLAAVLRAAVTNDSEEVARADRHCDRRPRSARRHVSQESSASSRDPNVLPATAPPAPAGSAAPFPSPPRPGISSLDGEPSAAASPVPGRAGPPRG